MQGFAEMAEGMDPYIFLAQYTFAGIIILVVVVFLIEVRNARKAKGKHAVVSTDAEDLERQACMAAHPAGKGVR